MINFKTYSKSYTLKKRLMNAPAPLEIPNTQEAIVPLAQWERVQELLARSAARRRNRQGVFSGRFGPHGVNAAAADFHQGECL